MSVSALDSTYRSHSLAQYRACAVSSGKLLFDAGAARVLHDAASRGDGGPVNIRLGGNELTVKTVELLCSTVRESGWVSATHGVLDVDAFLRLRS